MKARKKLRKGIGEKKKVAVRQGRISGTGKGGEWVIILSFSQELIITLAAMLVNSASLPYRSFREKTTSCIIEDTSCIIGQVDMSY